MPIECKLFEVRDRATFIPVLAIRMTSDYPPEQGLLWAVGWSSHDPQVVMARIEESRLQLVLDPSEWPPMVGRTLGEAHKYIAANFDRLGTGTVVDVEFILGESLAPKQPQHTPFPGHQDLPDDGIGNVAPLTPEQIRRLTSLLSDGVAASITSAMALSKPEPKPKLKIKEKNPCK